MKELMVGMGTGSENVREMEELRVEVGDDWALCEGLDLGMCEGLEELRVGMGTSRHYMKNWIWGFERD